MRRFFLPVSLLVLTACAAPDGASGFPEKYRASGNEPFWHLQVEGRTVRVQRPDAEPVIRSFDKDAVRTEKGWLLQGRDVALHVENTRCEDDMSGAPFADTVRFELDGRVYRGCGGQALPPDRLEQTQWVAETLRGRPVMDESRPFLSIDEQAQVSGSDGCNRISGGFSLQQDHAVKHIPQGWVSTRMACPVAQMQQAQEYGHALRSAIGWQFAGADLVLLDKAGVTVLRYRRSY